MGPNYFKFLNQTAGGHLCSPNALSYKKLCGQKVTILKSISIQKHGKEENQFSPMIKLHSQTRKEPSSNKSQTLGILAL